MAKFKVGDLCLVHLLPATDENPKLAEAMHLEMVIIVEVFPETGGLPPRPDISTKHQWYKTDFSFNGNLIAVREDVLIKVPGRGLLSYWITIKQICGYEPAPNRKAMKERYDKRVKGDLRS